MLQILLSASLCVSSMPSPTWPERRITITISNIPSQSDMVYGHITIKRWQQRNPASLITDCHRCFPPGLVNIRVCGCPVGSASRLQDGYWIQASSGTSTPMSHPATLQCHPPGSHHRTYSLVLTSPTTTHCSTRDRRPEVSGPKHTCKLECF